MLWTQTWNTRVLFLEFLVDGNDPTHRPPLLKTAPSL